MLLRRLSTALLASSLLAIAACGGEDTPQSQPDASVPDATATKPDASEPPGEDAGTTGTPDASLDAGVPDAGDQTDCRLDVNEPKWIAFSSRRGTSYDIYLVRADGSCERRLTDSTTDDLYPAWSPTGETLAYSSSRGGKLRVFLFDVAQGTETELQVGDLRATSPAFSPDGAWIAFEGRVQGTPGSDLYKVSSQGGEPVALSATAQHVEAGPVWSPDGTTIYFVSDRSGAYEIWSVGSDGQDAKKLTTGSRILGKPTVSPDGKTLVYARSLGTSSELAQLDLATGEVSLLSSEQEAEPAFDPAGGRLAVSSWRYGNPDVVLLDFPGGANPMRVTSDQATDGAPAIRP